MNSSDLSSLPPNIRREAQCQIAAQEARAGKARAARLAGVRAARGMEAALDAQFAAMERTVREAGSLTIVLSLPPQPLWQNRPCHWTKKSRATKAYRELAFVYANQALAHRPAPRWTKAVGQLAFFWPDKRRRDVRNAEAAMKAAVDGLVDAGVIVDDNADVLSWEATTFTVDAETARVQVTIRGS